VPDPTAPPRLCPQCQQSYPPTLEFFGSNKSRKDGLAVYCRRCQAEYNRQYRSRNAEKLKAQKRAYYQDLKADPERHAEDLRRRRVWKKANRKRLLPRDREYRQAHRAERNEYNWCWRRQNHEQALASVQRYRNRRAALPDGLTGDDWAYALWFWDNRCAYCGVSDELEPLETDHFIPISNELYDNPGSVPWNIVPACRSCNATKHNKSPEEFLLSAYPAWRARGVLACIRAYLNLMRWRKDEHEYRLHE
jgi:5-methylcytosine-specific restriction endonuclease McrA